ncbi:hypothetical protein CAMGR0001_0476 [Campylobacter gracilis RM3268]|uniref:Uncharacterized protein n=1 Tax=Campylobacter gracilis RM3268 TaxID=553220 RepID=C8PHN0_9BACT|nr:hypothetical protein CAMGR0001_0476 [Campylobacter gracilis RM3268]
MRRTQAVFERAESLDFDAVAIRGKLFVPKFVACKIYCATHKNCNYADSP